MIRRLCNVDWRTVLIMTSDFVIIGILVAAVLLWSSYVISELWRLMVVPITPGTTAISMWSVIVIRFVVRTSINEARQKLPNNHFMWFGDRFVYWLVTLAIGHVFHWLVVVHVFHK